MKELDRAGIFKARPLRWYIRKSNDTQAVALSMELLILGQWGGQEWADWSEYEEHSIYGDFWVVKSDGTVNVQTVENLAKAIGWFGDLNQVTGDPPAVIVQITVKEEQYKGRSRLKVAWINHGDYTPTANEVSPEEVRDLQNRFGSLLRAAASGAINSVGPTKAPAPAKTPKEKAPTGAKSDPANEQDDDCPF